MKTTRRGILKLGGFSLLVTCAGAFGCRSKAGASADKSDSRTAAASSARGAAASANALEPWQPVDPSFTSCAGTCSSKPAGRHASARLQPNAARGDETYCLVSGAVFRIEDASAKRLAGGRALYFCCEACATYFSEHAAAVLEQRHISLAPT